MNLQTRHGGFRAGLFLTAALASVADTATAGEWAASVNPIHGTPVVLYKSKPVVTASSLYWGENGVWVDAGGQATAHPGKPLFYKGSAGLLDMGIVEVIAPAGDAQWVYQLAFDVTTAHPTAPGGGWVFQFNKEALPVAWSSTAVELLPSAKGWRWLLAEGNEVRVEFSESLADISFVDDSHSSVRTSFYSGAVPIGRKELSCTVSLPQGTETRTTLAANPLDVETLRYTGYFDPVDRPGRISLAYSGSAVEARFTGTKLDASIINNADNYLNVIIDGGEPVKLKLAKQSAAKTYPLAAGMAPGVHSVKLFRRTEGAMGPLYFAGFIPEAGQTLLPLDARSDRRLLVVGDSISAGYGNEGSPYGGDTQNAYLTYGAIAARAFGAEYSCLAISGRGMYRSGNGSTNEPMPATYAGMKKFAKMSPYSNRPWVPNVIVINLGTNDFAQGTPDKTAFMNAYTKFVDTLRVDAPDAAIFCSVGSMMDPTIIRGWLQTMVESYNGNGDERIYYLEFARQLASDGYGADFHPNVITNGKMANVLVTAIKEKVGWKSVP
ncbi:MAG: SGNH/GDSL hydrolase family protein [Verrucomicrobiota bacterium]|nr:SGNH/GDSL hydrolase family protein [Verrucomicrobiota bacterium]